MPKSIRIIGIDAEAGTAIGQIREFGYEGVEVAMADDIAYLLSDLPERTSVMWALNRDEKIPSDRIRLSVILSGKELKLPIKIDF